MRTAYLSCELAPALPRDCRVLEVSALLKAALLALVEEPVLYDEAGRGGHLAALIVDEIVRATVAPLSLPLPQDPRLARLARTLLDHPGSTLGIDGWASEIGVSRRTLTRLFRTQTGLSFAAWRRRLRLLQAAARCAAGEPLAQAAASVGYESAAAFRAMARREFAGKVNF
jgi:AraC-like DNA-binding protein